VPTAFRTVVLWLCLGSAAALAQTAIENPAWSQLSAGEQRALAPIETEWDKLEPERKRKWRRVAKRFPDMSAEKQARLQRRMRDWVTLTGEQRRTARERYREIEKLSLAERQALREKWEQYQIEATDRENREDLEHGAPAELPHNETPAPGNPKTDSPKPDADTQPR
jgi:Protein of unknown function (DUF3106)